MCKYVKYPNVARVELLLLSNQNRVNNFDNVFREFVNSPVTDLMLCVRKHLHSMRVRTAGCIIPTNDDRKRIEMNAGERVERENQFHTSLIGLLHYIIP